jgi:hypothetical protein
LIDALAESASSEPADDRAARDADRSRGKSDRTSSGEEDDEIVAELRRQLRRTSCTHSLDFVSACVSLNLSRGDSIVGFRRAFGEAPPGR